MTNMQVGGRAEVPPMADWTKTYAGQRFRSRVLDPLSHETFRTMLRETYPAQLPPRSSGWWERYGHEVLRDGPYGRPRWRGPARSWISTRPQNWEPVARSILERRGAWRNRT